MISKTEAHLPAGYLNIKPSTQHFWPDKDDASKKPWFRTGDCGYLDKDGYLFIVARFKEQINRGGEKISPVEIDEVGICGYPLLFHTHPNKTNFLITRR